MNRNISHAFFLQNNGNNRESSIEVYLINLCRKQEGCNKHRITYGIYAQCQGVIIRFSSRNTISFFVQHH